MEDTLRDLEYTLAFHGAPALAGIKPADLVAWGSPQVCMGTLLEDYRRQLSRCGIQLRLLCSCRPRCLILVYRPERLAAQLAVPRCGRCWPGRATRWTGAWRRCWTPSSSV